MKKEKNEFTIIKEIVFYLIVLILAALFATSIGEFSKANLAAFWFIILTIFIAGVLFEVKLESKIGSYKCKKCGQLHKPSYAKVLFSINLGLTRYLKCPKCGKYSWNKKVSDK